MSIQRSLFCLCLVPCLFIGLGCNNAPDPETAAGTGEFQPAPAADPAPAPALQATDSTAPEQPTGTEPAEPGSGAARDTPAVASTPPSEAEPATGNTPAAGDAPDPDNVSRQDLIRRVSNGVVLVNVFDARGERVAFGSGSVVGDDRILTNYHVVAPAVTAKVRVKSDAEDAPELPVTGFLRVDEANDLALLLVEGLPDDLYRFEIGEPGAVEQFQDVFAIGHPDGIKFSATDGIVNGTMAVSELPEGMQNLMPSGDTQLIQSTTLIAPGSSGGPLFNLHGELIGINTLQLPQLRFAFSVAATHVRDLLSAAETAEVHSLPVPGADVLVTDSVANLWFDFQREWSQLIQDMRKARSPEELQQIVRANNPAPACARQCLDLVRANPGGPEAQDGLKLGADIVLTARTVGEQLADTARYYLDEALSIAASNSELTRPDRRVVNSLVPMDYSEALEGYLRAVRRDSDDEQTRAAAVLALALAYNAEQGTEYSADRDALIETLRSDFASVLVRGSRVQEYVETYLSGGGSLVGSMAQEIVGTDQQGVEFRLSDYAGKVVVLDFWADWCPHCRNMYPHERDMVERLKDEPFALLGINSDEPARAKQVIDKEITWRTWIDGREGPISEQWNITALPTVYVLDKEGRIRFQDVRGDELTAAVESLLFDSALEFANDIIAADAEWKYTAYSPAEDLSDWRTPEFDDSRWSDGTGTIGYGFGDLVTTVDTGDAAERPTTLLFRHRFDPPAGERPDRLYLNLRYNDGIAVYLNGKEVYRNNLSANAAPGDPALLRGGARESDAGRCIPIDAALLDAGGNVLAVELHQVSAYNADALFSLTFGGNLPDLTPDAHGNQMNRLRVCQLIGQVADGSGEYGQALKQYSGDDVPQVQITAAATAAMLDQPFELTVAETESQRYLVQMVMEYGRDAARIASTPGLSPQQYRAAVKMTKAAQTLQAALPEELRPILRQTVDGLAGTEGVALFRAGDYENAIIRLRESQQAGGDNPGDTAYLALAHRELGQSEEADRHRKAFVDMLNAPEWQHDRAGLEAAAEVEAAFGKQ